MPGAQEDDSASRETDDDAEGKALAEREAVLDAMELGAMGLVSFIL